MKRVLQFVVCSAIVLAPAIVAVQDAQPEWTKYAGVWRINTSLTEEPGPYVLLRISPENNELIVERSGNAPAEMLRYPLNGTPVSNEVRGGAVLSSAALEGPALVLKSDRKGADGRVTSTTDSISVSPNRQRLTVERTVAAGKEEKKTTLVFNRIPGNFLTHGGSGAQGPTNEKPEERGLPPNERERPADRRR